MSLSGPSIERPTNVRYVVLAWACSLSMLTYIDRVCIKAVAGDMQRDLGLTDQDFGWVFASFALSYALLEVPSGWLGDRYGARQVLFRIVLWWSLFTALTGCVPSFETAGLSLAMLVLVRFLFGAGEAGAYPNASRALRSWFPYSRRGFAQGMMWTFGRWGGAVAPSLIALFSMPYGWRGAFIGFGIVGAVWVICFVYFFRNSPAEHPGVNEAERALIQGKGEESEKLPISWRAMLQSPTLWCLSGMYLASNAGWCFFITWDRRYYETIHELEGGQLRIATSLPLFFGGVACYLGGLVTDRQVKVWGRRWGRTGQGALAYFLGAVFFLLALTSDQPWVAVGSLCIASFFKDFAMAVSWSTCIDIGHRYSGTVSGFMNMVGNLGTVIAPPIVAHLARRGQWNLALVFSASMFLTASILWFFVNPREVIVYSPVDRERLRERGELE